jgi:hypothetical protein
MKFTKMVWAVSAVVGVAATYALSFLPTPMLFPTAGVQELGAPAPVFAAPAYRGASLSVVEAGVVVDLLFWFLVAATVLSVVAGRKK